VGKAKGVVEDWEWGEEGREGISGGEDGAGIV